MSCRSGRCAPPLLLALLAAPSPAGAVGLPTAFPRTIAITGSDEGFRVTRFEVSTRMAGSKVAVTTRVTAASTGGTRGLVLAVAPCTRGPVTSPLCPPRATASVTVGASPVSTSRTFTVQRAVTTRSEERRVGKECRL